MLIIPHVNMMSSPHWSEFVIWIRYNMKEIKTNPKWIAKYSRMITGIFSRPNLIGKRGTVLLCGSADSCENQYNLQVIWNTPKHLASHTLQTPTLLVSDLLFAFGHPPHGRTATKPTWGRRDDTKKWNRRGCTHNTVTNTVSTLTKATVQGDAQIS